MTNDFSHRIEHTLLKPQATAADVLQLCDEATTGDLGFVCVNPWLVETAAARLAGTRVQVVAVVGFPLGAGLTQAKKTEARSLVEMGAGELDMVMNVGALKSGWAEVVAEDISEVVTAAQGRPVKVILETCLLNREEKILAVNLSRKAGAAFVKTSTGFGSGGASQEDVRLLKAAAGAQMGVKAAGGIRTLEQALAMIEAGADRIGTSSGAKIAREYACWYS